MALSAREQRLLRALRRRKDREAQGRFVAEGVRLVEDLLASGLPVRLLVAASSLEDTERGAVLLEEAARVGLPVRHVADREFATLAGTETPQGVLAVADTPRAALAELAPGDAPAVVLALDAVQDPGNFGTLVRTAEALGAAAVVMLPGTVDAWNAKSVRAAMGASFRLPVVPAAWPELRDWATHRAFDVLVADAAGAPLGTPPPPRAALVVGNEGAGVSADVRAGADRVVGIPLRGRAESLNVAAAAAILLHQLTAG